VEDMRFFNLFIQMLGLADLPLLGHKFTLVQPNRRCTIAKTHLGL